MRSISAEHPSVEISGIQSKGGELLIRIGQGFDAHRLVPGRELTLGGVKVPFHLGLEGHSDADALIHAVMDAILGALGKGDIGLHFPDTDPSYRGISSLLLLDKVREIMEAEGFCVENLDALIIAQHPKICPFYEQMKRNLADTLKVDPSRVNLKATTTEGLGFTGEGKGIAASAVVLLKESGRIAPCGGEE